MRFVCEHRKSELHSLRWRECGFMGRRAELMILPNFYVRVGAHPRAYELAIDRDGWRVFWPRGDYGRLWRP